MTTDTPNTTDDTPNTTNGARIGEDTSVGGRHRVIGDGDTAEDAGNRELSVWIKLGWVSALSGPLAYAVGRLIAETFYGHFHVLPSEVGLGYGALVAPALLIMLITVVSGALAILTGRAVVGAGLVLIIGNGILKLNDFDLHGIVVTALELSVLGIVAGLGLLDRAFRWRLWVGLLVVMGLVTAGIAGRTAARAATDATHGHPVAVELFGMPFTAIRATRVRITNVDTTAPFANGSCVLFLGQAGGVSVLVDGDQVWRVPSDYAMTASGC
jgi:hypothetical protein